MMDKLNKYDYYKQETDEEVEELLSNWDIVTCAICGKVISVTDAKISTIGNKEFFVCKYCE